MVVTLANEHFIFKANTISSHEAVIQTIATVYGTYHSFIAQLIILIL